MPALPEWIMILVMRRHLVLMFAAACMTFAMVSVSVADDRARIALVIGNGDYKGGRLSTTPDDAKLIAKTLRDLGFDVVDHQDIDLAGMKQAIQDLGDRLLDYKGAGMTFAMVSVSAADDPPVLRWL